MNRADREALAKVHAHEKWLGTARALIQQSAELHARIARIAPACTVAQRLRLHEELALMGTVRDEIETDIVNAAAGKSALSEGRQRPKRLKPSEVFVGGRGLPAASAPKRLTAGGVR